MKNLLTLILLLPLLVNAQLEQPKSVSVLSYDAYSIEYSEKYKVAKWSAYKFHKAMSINDYKRNSTFHIESRVDNKVVDSDYKGSGFDRGHLTPLANFRYDYDAMIQTNFYSNICAQTPGFNRGIWKRVENQVRRWVQEYDTLYIVSGPILSEHNKTIGENVYISSMFYKIIIAFDGTNYKSIAFLIPNTKSDIDIFEYQVSIDYIEVITGIDFYYRLDDKIENELERVNTLKK